MPPMGPGRMGGYLSEEEKKNRPKVLLRLWVTASEPTTAKLSR